MAKSYLVLADSIYTLLYAGFGLNLRRTNIDSGSISPIPRKNSTVADSMDHTSALTSHSLA
jgi:hypothetical protein